MGGIGAIAVAAPSVVAAAGVYLLDRYQKHATATTTTKVVGDGFNGLLSSWKVKGDQKKTKVAAPKFAPQFDGLHCFETLVCP